MPSSPVSTRSRSIRTVVAIFALTTILGGTAACSSGSDSATDAKADSSETTAAPGAKDSGGSDSDTDSNDANTPAGLPDGFPDVPVPEYSAIDVQQEGDSDGTGIWSVTFTVKGDQSDEEINAAYGKQLEDAGFKTEPKTHLFQASGNGLKVSYLASMGDLLVQIM